MENHRITLREIRARLRLSQQKLADLACVGRVTIWRAEQGERIQFQKGMAILSAINARLASRSYEPLCPHSIEWQVQGVYPENCVRLCGHEPVQMSVFKALSESHLTVGQVARAASLSGRTIYNTRTHGVKPKTAFLIVTAINQLRVTHNQPPIPYSLVNIPTRLHKGEV